MIYTFSCEFCIAKLSHGSKRDEELRQWNLWIFFVHKSISMSRYSAGPPRSNGSDFNIVGKWKQPEESGIEVGYNETFFS